MERGLFFLVNIGKGTLVYAKAQTGPAILLYRTNKKKKETRVIALAYTRAHDEEPHIYSV